MQQTFVKTIDTNQVEFNRLLYPLRYKVFIRLENKNPIVVVIQRDESKEWYIAEGGQNEDLVENLSDGLITTIKENEAHVGEVVV